MILVYYSNRLNRNKILIDIGKQPNAIYFIMLLVGLIIVLSFLKIEFLLLIKPIINNNVYFNFIYKKLSQKLHINCAVYLGIR